MPYLVVGVKITTALAVARKGAVMSVGELPSIGPHLGPWDLRAPSIWARVRAGDGHETDR
jgi:hypothetical protein